MGKGLFFTQRWQLGEELFEHAHSMGSLGPNCEYVGVADPIWGVSLEGERVIGLPFAAHIECVSTVDVEDDEVERSILQALLAYHCQG